MGGCNPNLDLINLKYINNTWLKISISSKDIEWKRNSDVYQGGGGELTTVDPQEGAPGDQV